jgi:hypothetical protein
LLPGWRSEAEPQEARTFPQRVRFLLHFAGSASHLAQPSHSFTNATPVAKDDEMTALLKAAGCRDATDFNLRLAASVPAIRTTIGGTSSPANLENYLTSAAGAKPLPPEILARVEQLQAR